MATDVIIQSKALYIAGTVSADGSSVIPGVVSNAGMDLGIDATVATLLAAGTFTSVSLLDISSYRKIVGTCFSDVAGTLYLYQYDTSAGTNPDGQDSIAYVGGSRLSWEFDVRSGWGRLHYVNGAVGQGTFRLYAHGKY